MLLGIDYGRKKIGLAIADLESKLSSPLEVIRFSSQVDAIKKIEEIVNKEDISQIVLGISEGKMAEKSREFGEELEGKLGVPIIYQDETLSTKAAQKLSIEGGMKRKKRKGMEDAFAAALILQGYLEQKV